MTPGNEGSEREAMTATRLGPVRAPEAAGLRSTSLWPWPGPVLSTRGAFRHCGGGGGRSCRRLGAVRRHRSGDLGGGRLRLLASAGTHVGGRRLRNWRRRTTRISQGALARRGFVDLRTAGRACLAVCRALVGRNAETRGVHRFTGVRATLYRSQTGSRPTFSSGSR